MPMSVARSRTNSPVRQSVTSDDDEADDEADDSNKAPVHRTFFPETWLWRLERMRSVPYKAVL